MSGPRIKIQNSSRYGWLLIGTFVLIGGWTTLPLLQRSTTDLSDNASGPTITKTTDLNLLEDGMNPESSAPGSAIGGDANQRLDNIELARRGKAEGFEGGQGGGGMGSSLGDSASKSGGSSSPEKSKYGGSGSGSSDYSSKSRYGGVGDSSGSGGGSKYGSGAGSGGKLGGGKFGGLSGLPSGGGGGGGGSGGGGGGGAGGGKNTAAFGMGANPQLHVTPEEQLKGGGGGGGGGGGQAAHRGGGKPGVPPGQLPPPKGADEASKNKSNNLFDREDKKDGTANGAGKGDGALASLKDGADKPASLKGNDPSLMSNQSQFTPPTPKPTTPQPSATQQAMQWMTAIVGAINPMFSGIASLPAVRN